MFMKKATAAILALLMMMTIIPSFAEDAAASGDAAIQAESSTETEITEVPAEEAKPAESETTEAVQGSLQDAQKLDAAYTLALNAITTEDYETAKEYINICFAYCDAQSNPVMFSDLLLKRACIDLIEQKNDMALLNLDAAIRVKPDLADAYLVKTQVYASMGDADRSIESLEKYIELTHDTTMYETVAQLQEAKGDIAAAQAAYDKYLQSAGANVEEAVFQSGLYKMESGQFEEAIKDFETYREHEIFGAGAMYNIGICKMGMEDYAGAFEAFTACEEKGGSFEGLYYNRGVSALMSADWARAMEDFTRSIETEPYKDDALFNLGVCQIQTGDYETAILTLTEYIGDPAQEEEENQTERILNPAAYYYRAVCYATLGKLEEAIADYTACIEQEYEPAQCYYERAQIYAAMGDTEKQNADLSESLKYSK